MTLSTLTVSEGKVIELAYTLKNASGDVLDEANSADPFAYLHGAAQIVSGLEDALVGLKVGDKKQVVVAPAEGYGELDPGLRMKVKRSQFPAGVKLESGMQFEANSPDGQGGVVFTVVGLVGDEVEIDGNHPLAGVTLHFDVEVLKVREATQEELAHGHAHGGDGHHHH
jgi:FKBP-type peptidyl-prolyl cis-trans isomerase SlyD